MITLKELSQKSGVSIATVSNILNGKSNVSDETRKRVLEIIKETGYKPNFMARGLRASSTKTIGLIVDDITEFSSPQIINGIMSKLEEKGYRTILENLRFYTKWGHGWENTEDYKKAIDSAFQEFIAIKTDGIIYVSGHAREISDIPQKVQIPLVVCYAFTERENTPFIMIDDEDAAFQMTEHLLGNRKKKIAVITGTESNIHTIKRLQGYKKALQAHGIEYDESIIKTGDWSDNSGYENCRILLKENEKLSALFCFNDMMAAGAYRYLNEAGLIPGKDISVAGFDNRDIAAFLNPPLTTMEIPLFLIGENAAQTILDKINSKNGNEQNLYIQCKLIDRNSVIKDK
ncbi:MAG: LacI family DNA-binding transcriptional regulator [Treponema sp.]|nr:LacI family DNA-binding transcriptional regulator [Treponema sp.]